MAGPNLNKVFLIGRLTRDPEMRYTTSGQSVATSRLAINREYVSKEEKREDTCFINIVTWAKKAEIFAEYLKKGSLIFIEGRLQYNEWETPEKEKRSTIEVVVESFQFLDSPAGRMQEKETEVKEEVEDGDENKG